MDSTLEQQRRLHEELEHLEQAITQLYLAEPRSHRDRLLHDHRVNTLLDRILARSNQLHALYADEDRARQLEIDRIGGSDPFPEFYAQLRQVKEYFRVHPDAPVDDPAADIAEPHNGDADAHMEAEQSMVEGMFSGEEMAGRYLDLHRLHEQFINLKGVKPIHYLAYLDCFHKLDSFSRELKNADYKSYLNALQDYLGGFFSRVRPLMNMKELRAEAETEFSEAWDAGSVPGWPKEVVAPASASQVNQLFCAACKKLYSKQTVYDAHLTSKKHIKAVDASTDADSSTASSDRLLQIERGIQKKRDIAFQEALIGKYAEVLEATIQDTKASVERRQTLTDKEREVEIDTGAVAELSDTDDDAEPEQMYNPLKLPLGWDGKPIPYWLYKLHGLGVEYPCEICGNFVYMGRKAFEKHFQEWRHAHGMRCLGIPNTKHFQEIVSIEDAYRLWEKLRHSSRLETQQREAVEEFEDAYGNVYSKKTYEDLRRQGLL